MQCVNLFLVVFIVTVNLCWSLPAEDGKYSQNKYNQLEGLYRRSNEGNALFGKYVPRNDNRYVHVHDNRELGKYVHVHIPYDGGYGPYSGGHELYRYLNDPTGDYSNADYNTVSNDPFNINNFYIPSPRIQLEYGFPQHSADPGVSKQKRLTQEEFVESSDLTKNENDKEGSEIDAHVEINVKHVDDSNVGAGQDDSLHGDEQVHDAVVEVSSEKSTDDVPKIRKRKSVSDYSQKSIADDDSKRSRYNNEGGWKIIRQEEQKNLKNYDFLYETENGIYAEEKAVITNKLSDKEGTQGEGYYQYTGDDGKLYRVDYTVGDEGFQPRADHIPTPPPVPIAIQRALDYVKSKNQKL